MAQFRLTETMRCARCTHGGAKFVDARTNERRCPLFYHETTGRCSFQLHGQEVPDFTGHPRDWLRVQAQTYSMLLSRNQAERQQLEATGAGAQALGRNLATAIKILTSMQPASKALMQIRELELSHKKEERMEPEQVKKSALGYSLELLASDPSLRAKFLEDLQAAVATEPVTLRIEGERDDDQI